MHIRVFHDETTECKLNNFIAIPPNCRDELNPAQSREKCACGAYFARNGTKDKYVKRQACVKRGI